MTRCERQQLQTLDLLTSFVPLSYGFRVHLTPSSSSSSSALTAFLAWPSELCARTGHWGATLCSTASVCATAQTCSRCLHASRLAAATPTLSSTRPSLPHPPHQYHTAASTKLEAAACNESTGPRICSRPPLVPPCFASLLISHSQIRFNTR